MGTIYSRVFAMSLTFSARLSGLRKERGISQKEAAAALGVSQALLSHYENGIRECGLDFVVKAGEFYGVTCDYLLGMSDSRMGLDGALRREDVSEDDVLNLRTFLRALSVTAENAAACGGKECGDILRSICSLTLYRLILSQRDNGYLPEELFSVSSETGRYASYTLIQKLESDLMNLVRQGEAPRDLVPAKSVETLIEYAENCLKDSIKDMFAL